MMWHPMPSPTSWSSSARVEMLWGQPEQKYGVRGAGAQPPRSLPLRSLPPRALLPRSMRIGAPALCRSTARRAGAGKVLVVPQAGQGLGHERAGHRPMAREEGPAVAVLLAEMRGWFGCRYRAALSCSSTIGALSSTTSTSCTRCTIARKAKGLRGHGRSILTRRRPRSLWSCVAEAEVVQRAQGGRVGHAGGHVWPGGVVRFPGDAVQPGQLGVLVHAGDAHADRGLPPPRGLPVPAACGGATGGTGPGPGCRACPRAGRATVALASARSATIFSALHRPA